MSMAKFLTVAATLLPLVAGATTPGLYPSYAGSGNGTEPVEANYLLTTANLQPNASERVDFGQFYSQQGSSYQPSNSYWSGWSWNIKVSDVFVLNSSATVPNAHVAYTTYDFNWPGAGNVQEAVQASQATNSTTEPLTCIAIYDFNFTAQASTMWHAEPSSKGSSSCEPLVNSACLSYLASRLAAGGCQYGRGDVDWNDDTYRSDICGSTLAVNLDMDLRTSRPAQIYNLTDPAAASDSQLVQGQPFYYTLSEPYPADNRSVYDDYAWRVRIMGLVTPEGPTIMCNRAELGPGTGAAPSLHGARNAAAALLVASALAFFCL